MDRRALPAHPVPVAARHCRSRQTAHLRHHSDVPGRGKYPRCPARATIPDACRHWRSHCRSSQHSRHLRHHCLHSRPPRRRCCRARRLDIPQPPYCWTARWRRPGHRRPVRYPHLRRSHPHCTAGWRPRSPGWRGREPPEFLARPARQPDALRKGPKRSARLGRKMAPRSKRKWLPELPMATGWIS